MLKGSTCLLQYLARELCRYCDGQPAGWPGFDSQRRQEVILYFAAFNLSLDPNRPYSGKQGALLLGIKMSGREPDQLPQSSHENKNDIDVRLLSRTTSKRRVYLSSGTNLSLFFFCPNISFPRKVYENN
jgi:hypothetical protein